ncbi:unnamed protein product [Phytophthora lilii]|uniref:Unnamed protein product n=1 Tax=Phytophthora lilii TaxID=2077276 RepID=A0A9W6U2W5_9STRA|nr:unnamed protein product [Phytophthora lilii]
MEDDREAEDAVKKHAVKTGTDKSKAKRSRRKSWSDEDDSESDDEHEDDHELDSDSEQEGSQDSLSDDDQDEKALSFASAEDAPKPSPKAGPASANSAPSNSVPRGPAAATQQIVPADTARNNETNCRVVLQTNVFAPVFYPEAYKPDRNDRDFEYVMVLISSRPLGLGIASSNKCPGIFLLARTTVNPAVVAALDRDVIQNGDEIFAFNDLVLRNSTVKIFTEEVVPSVTLPVRCWFRTKRKSKIFSAASSELVSVGADAPARTSGKRLPSVEKVTSLDTYNYSMTVPGEKPRDTEGGVVSLGIDWPWLQEKLEDMCGVRLNSSHPEYEQVRELLVMPRRERVPSYLVEFRKTRMEKQHFLSSDIFMGVLSESKDVGGEVDEQTPLEVGTTVTVAKRTWPGMNKLGGAGRIRKVNEKTLPDGTKRFTYNVALVLGGYDNNVERKYISVVDLEAEESEQHEESTTGRRHKSEKNDPEPDVKDATDEDTSITSVRLSFSLLRTEDDDKLAALPDAVIDGPPKKRRFQLQFSTANSAVYCERKNIDGAPAKEMLLHRHFDVKLPETDALTNACFSSELLDIEDRVGDEVDEDDTDSEGEVDEIKTELATLQSQFRAVMEKNEQAFVSLTKKVEEEYASKGYRQWEFQDIEWRNYERMYQEMQAAKRQFEDSDDESDDDEDGRVPGSGAGKRRKPESEDEESEPEDVSFGDTGDVVHPQCAMFTPETFFKDGVVYGVNLVDPERRRLKCSICGGRKGLSKIQCAHRKCVQAYHVACAFVNGLLISDPYYQAWCPRHLKTSGLGQFVDLPAHMNKDRSAIATNDTPGTTPASSPARRNRKNSRPRSRQKKSSSRQDTTPAEPTTVARAEISSSKTNRKRKRKGSNAGATATASNVRNAAHGNRGSSPRNNAAVEGPEPRCARRLEIELSDDSDHEGKAVGAWQQGRDQQLVFAKNDVVEVLTRDWRGINKPGGVARVRAVSLVPNDNGGKDVFYDVNYVMGTYKEKRVPARFVRSYNQGDAE